MAKRTGLPTWFALPFATYRSSDLSALRISAHFALRSAVALLVHHTKPNMPRKSRRSSDPIRDMVVVEMSDGTKLRCSLTSLGRGVEPRWMLLDAKGEQFVGPIATPDRTPEGVQRLVDEHTQGRALGFLGEPRVDVLELNLALARAAGS